MLVSEELLNDRTRVAELRQKMEEKTGEIIYEIIRFVRIGIAHTIACDHVEIDAVSAAW